ncbi:helix-turn-helix domain-containing protein [Actinomadura scrupuli]|uniref:helix-turn-helix domain-containing protein n=1 Tax=Actinomadura scrupuli TaxID=559629 RepID=UPI003D97E710
MGRRPKKLDPTASVAALLGSKVRIHRERKGWTQDHLGPMVWVTGDQISKIEIAKRMPSWEAVTEFDRLFGTGEYFQDLWHLANKETLPEWFRPYAELEPEAGSLRIFRLGIIHGLLQTKDHARDLVGASQDAETRDRFVEARMKRQEILDRKEPPWLWVVIDETAFRPAPGGNKVMRDQIAHLIDLAQRPTITLQIIPMSRANYLGRSGSMTILSFDEGPNAIYVEDQVGGRLVEEASAVEKCEVRFDLIRASALSQEESREFLEKLLESL